MLGEKYKDSGDILAARQVRNAQAEGRRVIFDWSGTVADSRLPQHT